MKKSINITINNLIFQIEEDAYDLLDKYLISIKDYYGREKEGGEILFDIEASIAEKFSNKINKNKQVVNLGDVKEVIRVMGEVQEFEQDDLAGSRYDDRRTTQDEEDTEDGGVLEDVRIKKLYRDTDDQIIAGICSGIAIYFGVDPIFIRILFIILFFVNGVGLLIYVILWAIVPLAKTSTQKLEMRGRPINLKKIEQVVKEKSQMIKEEGKTSFNKLKKNKSLIYKIFNFPIKVLESIFSFCKKILSGVWPVTSVFLGIIFIMTSFCVILGLSVVLGMMLFYVNSPYIVSDLPLVELANSFYYYLSLVSFYFLILIPLLFIFVLGVTMIRRKNSFSVITSSVLFGFWILAVIGSIGAGGHLALRVNTEIERSSKVDIEEKVYDQKDFKKLYIAGNFDAKIRKGDEFMVLMRGKEEDLERVEFNIEDGQLQIMEKKKREDGKICIFCMERESDLEIVMPELDSFVAIRNVKADVFGFEKDIYISLGESAKMDMDLLGQSVECKLSGISGGLELTGTSSFINCKLDGSARLTSSNLEVENMKLTQEVFSRVVLDGRADEMEVVLEDSSRISADNFFVKDIVIKTKDHARAEIRPRESLKALATDYSRIYYIGNPENLIEKTDGSGVIEREDDIDWK